PRQLRGLDAVGLSLCVQFVQELEYGVATPLVRRELSAPVVSDLRLARLTFVPWKSRIQAVSDDRVERIRLDANRAEPLLHLVSHLDVALPARQVGDHAPVGTRQNGAGVGPRHEPAQRDDATASRDRLARTADLRQLVEIDRQRGRATYRLQIKELQPIDAALDPAPALQQRGEVVARAARRNPLTDVVVLFENS